MKKHRAGRIAALMAAAMLLSLALSVSAAAAVPLQITRDLESEIEVTAGETVALSVEAVGGSGSISYQWYSSAGPLNCVAPTVSFTVSTDDVIYCVVRSGNQVVESTHCALRVSVPYDPGVKPTVPRISVQPLSINLKYGQTGILSVKATCKNQAAGLGLVYQWYCSPVMDVRYASPISGATSPSYVVPASYTPSRLYYACKIYSTNGVDKSAEVFTNVATVYCGELAITKHPTGESVTAGGKATFIARADGAASFQWRIVRNDGSNGFFRADEAPMYISGLQVIGADTDTLVLANIPESMNGMSIICVFYADAARTQFKITNSALLTVRPKPTPTPVPYVPKVTATPTAAPAVRKTILAPSISLRPEINVSGDGNGVSLAVSAVDNNSGGTSLKYQWYRNTKNSNSGGTAISGARSASYIPADSFDGKYYYVSVWATDGTTTSKVAYSEPVLLDSSIIGRGTLLAPSISVRPEVALSENGRNALLSILAVDNNDGTELEFQWYRNTVNSNSGGTAISSAHYESYSPILLNSDRYYYVTVWATDGEKTSKVACSEPVLVSKTALTGNSLLAPSVSVRPELITSADGKSVSLTVRAVDNNSADTELQFQWYKSKTNSVSGGVIISGADEASYVPKLSADYKYYYVAVWATDGDRTSKVAYSGPVLVS